MDARSYLEQVVRLSRTVESMRAHLEQMHRSLDLLRTTMGDGMPRGASDGKPLERAYAEYDEVRDAYARELDRWGHLEAQASLMLLKARQVLMDGSPHAITLDHISVIEAHYFGDRLPYTSERYGERTVSTELHIAERTVERYAHDALDWLDYSRDADGYPLVPVVSE